VAKPSAIAVMEEMFEDTKWVITSSKSKKDRHYNDKQNKEERTQNDLQNTTHKTKGRVTQTPLFGKATKVIEICSKINYFGLIWFRLNNRIA
jgi:hypothetical protein